MTHLNNSPKYLIRYLYPYKILLSLMLSALITTSSSVLLLSKSIEYIIDRGVIAQNIQALNTSLIYLLALIVILAIATAARYALITIVGERAIADLRADLFAHTLKLKPEFIESQGSGAITSRIINDTTILQAVITGTFSIAIRNCLLFFGGFIMLLTLNLKLTALMIVVSLIVIFPILMFGRRTRAFSRLVQDKIAKLTSKTEESGAYIKTVQAYCQETFEIQSFRKYSEAVVNAALEKIKIRAILIMLVIFLIFSAIACMLWVGSYDVLIGKISTGELTAFIFLSVVCAGAFGSLTDTFAELQKAAGATERLTQILNIQPETKKATISDIGPHTSIGFTNVDFYYPSRPQEQILKQINLNINKGEKIAIVGKSGSGKTTIVQLLLKFYQPQAGKISFNGLDIDNIKTSILREKIAYVSQDPAIFTGNIRENISYSKPDASEEDIVEAAKSAAIWDYIKQLPEKLDTFIGYKGISLSGGQKQRISLARALLKKPEIIILDEATSAIDSENTELIQQILNKLLHDRTILIISHRLSTIRDSNKIILIDKGVIVEAGTHTELMKNKHLYYELSRIYKH